MGQSSLLSTHTSMPRATSCVRVPLLSSVTGRFQVQACIYRNDGDRIDAVAMAPTCPLVQQAAPDGAHVGTSLLSNWNGIAVSQEAQRRTQVRTRVLSFEA